MVTTRQKTEMAVFETGALQKAFDQVMQVSGIRATLRVLRMIKMDVADGEATLTSTDLQMAVSVKLPVKKDSGNFTLLLPRTTTRLFLNGKNETTIISRADAKRPSGDHVDFINLERPGYGNITVSSIKPADFPPLPKDRGSSLWMTLDSKWLCRMFGIVLKSCAPAKELSRPVLNGISWKDGELASADGFRLSIVTEASKLYLGLQDKQIIIHQDALILVNKLFKGVEHIDVKPDVEHNQIRFRSTDQKIEVVSQLTQDFYPKYEQLIPKEFYSTMKFSAPVLAERLNLIDPQMISSGIIRLTTEKGQGGCKLASGIQEEADYQMEMPATTEGEATKIAFNYKYILDAIKPFSMCELQTTNPSSPGKITGDLKGVVVVVMPMFVKW